MMVQRQTRAEMQAQVVRQRRDQSPVAAAREQVARGRYNAANAAYRNAGWRDAPAAKAALLAAYDGWEQAYAALATAVGVTLDD